MDKPQHREQNRGYRAALSQRNLPARSARSAKVDTGFAGAIERAQIA
jgi:hypothetical protein